MSTPLTTNAEWQACSNPIEMLECCQRKRQRPTGQGGRWISDRRARVDPVLQRKLRLAACAFCRRIWYDLPEGAYQDAIELTERYADGEIKSDDVRIACEILRTEDLPYEIATRGKIHRAIRYAMRLYPNGEDVPRMFYVALSTAWEIGELEAVPRVLWKAEAPQWDAYSRTNEGDLFAEGQRMRAIILRDVIPSPFADAEFDPAWLSWQSDTITHVARTIYDQHRFRDLPILADALEEAGCTEPRILKHCRQNVPHVRGCWVIDGLLGKG